MTFSAVTVWVVVVVLMFVVVPSSLRRRCEVFAKLKAFHDRLLDLYGHNWLLYN